MIGLLLTSLIIFLARRRSRSRCKTHKKFRWIGKPFARAACVLSLVRFLPVALIAQNVAASGSRLTGTISGIKDDSPVYVYLFTEAQRNTVGTGFRVSCLRPAPEAVSVRFQFDDIPAVTYALRAFQDTNRNGKLDSGLFGPKEPWALSFQSVTRRMPPRFEDMDFRLTSDRNIDMQLVE